MSTVGAMSGTLATHLLVARREEVDHPARPERDLADGLGGADGERSEEVLRRAHRPQPYENAPESPQGDEHDLGLAGAQGASRTSGRDSDRVANGFAPRRPTGRRCRSVAPTAAPTFLGETRSTWTSSRAGTTASSPVTMTALSDQAWRRAIRTGTLVRLYPGVARLVGTATSPEQRIIAAVFAVGHGAMASHRSSAFLWGVPRPTDDPIDVIVTNREGVRSPRGVHVHRPRDVRHLSPQRQTNIRCTNIVRTLCDLGAVDPAGVVDAVGHALGARMLSLRTLEVALQQHARPGRNGITALRAAIDAWAIDTRPADSLLERAMHALVTRYGLPPVEFHKVIEGWEVDFWVVGTPIVIECDGWATHGLQHEQFERDRQRDAELVAAGWIVVRFTYRAVTPHSGQDRRTHQVGARPLATSLGVNAVALRRRDALGAIPIGW